MAFCFAEEEVKGGWAVGTIEKANADESETVEIGNSDGLRGTRMANLVVGYGEYGTVTPLLLADQYATSKDAPEGSWVLLWGALKKTPSHPLRPALKPPSGRTTPTTLMLPPPSPRDGAITPTEKSAQIAMPRLWRPTLTEPARYVMRGACYAAAAASSGAFTCTERHAYVEACNLVPIVGVN